MIRLELIKLQKAISHGDSEDAKYR